MSLQGLIDLFTALNRPCECERGVFTDENGKKILECARHPLPEPGYRWYREYVEPRNHRTTSKGWSARGMSLVSRLEPMREYA